MFGLMAPKGGLVGTYPTKQLRTHRARASHATSPHPFTHNSPVPAPNRERFQGRARRCRPGSPARREGPEGRGHARGCPVGLAGPAAEGTKRGRPSARRGSNYFRAAASNPPTPSTPGHTLSILSPRARTARPPSSPWGRGARRLQDASRQ